MLRGTDAELVLGGLGQLADSDTSHAINDITAINDCKNSSAVLVPFLLRMPIQPELDQSAN
jgi:hypothetical protein